MSHTDPLSNSSSFCGDRFEEKASLSFLSFFASPANEPETHQVKGRLKVISRSREIVSFEATWPAANDGFVTINSHSRGWGGREEGTLKLHD